MSQFRDISISVALIPLKLKHEFMTMLLSWKGDALNSLDSDTAGVELDASVEVP